MAVHRGKIAVAGASSQSFVSLYVAGARPSDDHPTVTDWLMIDGVTLEPRRVLKRINLLKRLAPGNGRKKAMMAPSVIEAIVAGTLRCGVDAAALTATDAIDPNWARQAGVMLPA